MKNLKIYLLLLSIPVLAAFTVHKFYVSMTKMEYVEEKQSLQIISKIFIDDIEDVLQLRYSKDISLATKKETAKDEAFLAKYILQKLKVSVNGKEIELNYIGKEYDNDMVKIYLEGEDISSLEKLEVSNKVLYELFPEQQNIIHFKSGDKKRSMILEKDKPSGMLNFN